MHRPLRLLLVEDNAVNQTDQTMPGMSGLALAGELQGLRPDIPILLCTGFSPAVTAETTRKLGINAVLMKPLALRDLAQAIRRALEPQPAAAAGVQARIVVIDDEPPLRSLLQHVLTAAGHTVMEASNGAEGVRCCRTTPVDLVITDLLMPEQEGLETIQILRREFPAIKIIAISGGGITGRLEFLSVAQMLGAQRTLRKPFEGQELLAAVREVMQDQG